MEMSRRDMMKGMAASGLTVIASQALPGGAAVGLARNPPATPASYAVWSEALAGHKITKIEHRMVQNRWPRLVPRNAQLGVHGWGGHDACAIIHTDKGAMGWGAAYGMNEDQGREYTDRYMGRAITDLFNPAIGTNDGVPHHLDLALHDVAGVALDIPVYEMLGSRGPIATPCYSGMIYFDDIEPLEHPPGMEQVLFNAGADYQFGYRQMKIKVGRGHKWMPHDAGLQRDIDITNALAKAYPDVTYLADANDGFSIDDTLHYLDRIETELLFIEEPFRENIDGFAKLRTYLDKTDKKTLIADGESRPDPDLLDQLIAEKLLDVHLTDTYGLGFTNWRKLMPSLAERGVLTSPHTWGSRLKTVYTTHLARGLGNVLTIEGVTAFSEDVDFAGYDLDKNGRISPPNKPGFGLTLR